MNRNEVVSLVEHIFISTFKVDGLVITSTTNPDDIKGWDSLNHIIFIGDLEKEFKVKFALGEIMDLKSFGVIIDLLMLKLSPQQ